MYPTEREREREIRWEEKKVRGNGVVEEEGYTVGEKRQREEGKTNTQDVRSGGH